MTTATWRNWSGRVTADPAEIAHPADTAEIAAIVASAASAGRRVKPVGSGHSFTEIAVTDGVQLRLDRLSGLTDVDTATGLVTVRGGTPLHVLGPRLAEHGLAMENLGDIDRQTITGATSTGTHGTGAAFGGIATQIRGMELVLADGSVVRCSPTENPRLLEFARVGLGALGVVSELTLRCVPSFALHVIDEPMPLAEVLERLDDLVAENDHFEFFWFPYTETALTRRFARLPADTRLAPVNRFAHWFDDRVVTNVGFDALNRISTRLPAFVPTANRIVSGSLSRREYTDLSHRVFASRRDVRFNEGEYAFGREHTRDLLGEIRRWLATAEQRVSFPLEVRFVAADDIPLAPTYRRTSGYIAFHQYHRMDHQPFFGAMEDIFATVGGRPHWGKMHRLDAAELRGRYPRFDEFTALRAELDPAGIFANPYLDRVLGPVTTR